MGLRYDRQLDSWVSETGPGVTKYRKADEDQIRSNGDILCTGMLFGCAVCGVLFSLIMSLGYYVGG